MPPQATTPPWNSWSHLDIGRMLAVIAPAFDKVRTYGMSYLGYYQPNTPWNQVDSNCHVAFAAAQAANLVFAKKVMTLVFTNEYVTDATTKIAVPTVSSRNDETSPSSQRLLASGFRLRIPSADHPVVP